MTGEKGRKPLPPYVSYRTFRNFIDGLQIGVPARIDRSYWGERYSGSSGTQLMSALRFLGLIDTSGTPLTRLRQLVSATGSQKSEVLRQISHTAYEFLSERTFDPQLATYSQLEEIFYNSYQVTGDVARKCIKFFISMQEDAGVALSPFITKRSKTLRSISSKKRIGTKTARTNRNTSIPNIQNQAPKQNNWYEMVLTKFPSFDPAWSDDVKLKWFDAFDSLLKRDSSTLIKE